MAENFPAQPPFHLPQQLQCKLKVSVIEGRGGNCAHIAGRDIRRRIAEVTM